MEVLHVFPPGHTMEGRRCAINVTAQQCHGDTRSDTDPFSSSPLFFPKQTPRNNVFEVFRCLQSQPKSKASEVAPE